jgi:hypothetical protein
MLHRKAGELSAKLTEGAFDACDRDLRQVGRQPKDSAHYL